MKTKHFFFWLAIVAICVTLFSTCKKDKEDYRDKWVGEWDFVVEKFWWVGGEETENDTLYYSGKISLGDNDNDLYVEYIDNDTLNLIVNEDGELSVYDENYHYHAEGQFERKNKVHFKFHGGGLGGGSTYTVDGIKKEGGKK